MKGPRVAPAVIVAGLFAVLGTPAFAETHHAKLEGFREVPVVITNGQGDFKVTINQAGTSLDFELNYEGLEGGDVLQAHIHVGQPNVNGGIVIFLCTNLTPPAGVPAPPPCPTPSGTVTGTRTAADVIAQTTQGVASAELAAVIFAIRHGKAYANVHTTASPGGEIRGQIKK